MGGERGDTLNREEGSDSCEILSGLFWSSPHGIAIDVHSTDDVEEADGGMVGVGGEDDVEDDGQVGIL